MTNDEAAAQRAIASLGYLTSLLRSDTDVDRLIDGYLETRLSLAKAFRDIGRAHLGPVSEVLESVRAGIGQRMVELYGGSIPSRYLHVRRYGPTHQLLAACLFRRVGRPVPASRLRLLTGEQVHTERRVRELRDLGLSIEARRVAGENQYILASREPDLDHGAVVQLAQNIRSSDLDTETQSRLLSIAGLV